MGKKADLDGVERNIVGRIGGWKTVGKADFS